MAEVPQRRKSTHLLIDSFTTRVRRLSLRSPTRSSKNTTSQAVIHLPGEIVLQLVHELKLLHACRTCYERDLTSLISLNRTFYNILKPELYRNIKIQGPDSTHKKKKKHRLSRLSLLLRTLSHSSQLSVLVRVLNLSTPLKEEHDIIAQIITYCTRLERFTGQYEYFPQPLNGNSAKAIGEALYACTSLKEHSWWASTAQAGFQWFGFKIADWVEYHANWSQLETLVFRGWRIERALNKPLTDELLVAICKRLPSLKRLAFSSLEDEEMSDLTLQHIREHVPSLQCLRLESLSNITTQGLHDFVRDNSALTSLSLIDMPQLRISTDELVEIIASLRSLQRFIFISSAPFELAPIPPHLESLTDDAVASVEHQPVFSSATIEYIHWHITPARPANDWLRHAILNGSVPKLSRIQVPKDEHCLLQAICNEIVVSGIQSRLAETLRAIGREPTIVDRALKRLNECNDSTQSHNGASRDTTTTITPTTSTTAITKTGVSLEMLSLHPLQTSFILRDKDLEWMKAGNALPVPTDHDYSETGFTEAELEIEQQSIEDQTAAMMMTTMSPTKLTKCNGWRKDKKVVAHVPRTLDLWEGDCSLLNLF